MIKSTKTKSNIQNVNTNIHLIDVLDQPKQQFKKLKSNDSFELIVDYPIARATTFQVKTGKKGLDFPALLRKIGQVYSKIYKNQDKYGVWGHSIGDLFIEGISVDHDKKKIKLIMGS